MRNLSIRAIEIAKKYDELNKNNGSKSWDIDQYVQGLNGDIGDLNKLILAKKGFRSDKGFGSEIDAKISHELSDILWSVFVIADKLGIDIEETFLKTMDELEERLS